MWARVCTQLRFREEECTARFILYYSAFSNMLVGGEDAPSKLLLNLTFAWDMQ